MKAQDPIRSRASLLATALVAGLALNPASAATYNWSRGVAVPAGSTAFSWNNSTLNGDATNGNNWASTPSGAFPNAVGDIANLANAAGGNNQPINLNQNITLGAISNIGSTNGSGTKTIAAGGAFTLTFDNGASDASIAKLNTTNSNAATISAPVAIAGNGNLILNNSSTNTLTLSGGLTSALASGTQKLTSSAGANAVNGVIGNGSSGGTMSVEVTAGTLSLVAANSYTGSTTITGGTLSLTGTAGALATGSAITNNGTFAINRTNAVVQGTDFSAAGIGGSGALNATGTGLVLTLNTANGYAGTTNIGAGANNSVLRATASGALGSGTIQFDATGNASTARLELSGGIALDNATIQFAARNNASVGIQNLGGNNTLSGDLNLQSGGTTHLVQSDDGLLTLSGNIANALGTGTRTLTVTGAGNGLISGAIGNGTGTTALAKDGAGTWTLGNGSTYTGATTVTAGTLFVNGSLGNTAVSVTGGTLGGSGAIAGTVAVTGTGSLAAGTSIESLATGALSMGAGTSFVYEAANNGATGADLVAVGGTLSLTDVNLDLTAANLASAGWIGGNKITLISYTGTAITGGFLGYADDSLHTFGANQWRFDYDDTAAGSNFAGEATGTSFVTLTVIPEPGAALLGGIGLLALLRRRRR